MSSQTYLKYFKYLDINRTYPEKEVNNDIYESLSINISMFHIHPNWDTSSTANGYDIALIIFNNNTIINITINPIPILQNQLNNAQDCCNINEEFIAIGYGKNETDGVGTMTLEKTTLKYIQILQCVEMWYIALNASQRFNETEIQNDIENEPPQFICVMGNNTDLCQGMLYLNIFIFN